MANPTITAKIALDISELQSNLKAATEQSRAFTDNVQKQLKTIKINVETGDISGAGKELLDTINKIRESASKPVTLAGFAESYKQATTSANDLLTIQKQALAQLVATGQQGTDAYKDLLADTIKTKAETSELDKALEQVNKEIGDVAKKENPFGKLFQFNQITQAVNTAAQALNGVISVGSEFEASVAAVGAITGQSGDALESLGDKARELAVEFGGSATAQLASFQGILSKLGPQVAETPAALALMAKNVNLLSAASGDAADVSMSAIVDSMLQFGLVTGDSMKDAETSTRIINGLAASAQVGAAEIPQVAEAILQAGVAAKGANLSFEATNAAIQVLAVGGKTGSEAGVALRNVLGLIQKASGPAAQTMQNLGTSSQELGEILTTQGLGAALTKIKTGMNNLGSAAERNAALMTIFGTENSAAAGILLDNIGLLGEFEEGIIAGNEGLGAAAAQAAVRMDTASTKIAQAKAFIEDKFIDLFQFLGQGISTILGTVSEVGPALAGIASIQTLIPEGAFDDFKSRAQSAFSATKDFAQSAFFDIADDGTASLKSLGDIAATARDAVTERLSSLSEAAKPLADNISAGFSAARDSILSSFTQVDVAGKRSFVGLGQSLSNIGGSLKDLGANILKTLVPSLFTTATASGAASAGLGVTAGATTASGAAATVTAGSFGAMWGAILGPITAVVAGLALVGGAIYLLYQNSETVRNIIDAVVGAVVDFGKGVFSVVQAIGAVVLEAGTLIFEYLITPFQLAYEFVASIFSTIGDVLSGIFGGLDLFGFLSEGAEGEKSVITSFFDAIVASIKQLGKILSDARKTLDAWKQTAINAVRGFANFIRPAIETAAGAFLLLYGALKEVAEFIGGIFLAVFESIGSVVISVGELIVGQVVNSFREFLAVVRTVAEFVADTFVSAWNSLVETIENVIDVVQNSFVQAFEAVRGAIGSAISAVVEFVSSIPGVSAVIDGIKAAINGVSGAIEFLIEGFNKAGDAITYVKGLIGGLGGALDVAKNAIVTFLEGITEFDADKISGAFDNLGSRITAGFTSGFSEKVAEEKSAKFMSALQKELGKYSAETDLFGALSKTVKDFKIKAPSLDASEFAKTKNEISQTIAEFGKAGKLTDAQLKELNSSLSSIVGKQAEAVRAGSKAAIEQIKELEETSSTLTDKQIKARKKAIEEQLDTELDSGKLQQSEYKALYERLDAIGKKGDDSAAKRREKALEEFRKLEQKSGAQALDDELARKEAEISNARAAAIREATEKARIAGIGQERLNKVIEDINAEHDRKLADLRDTVFRKANEAARKAAEEQLKIALDANKKQLDAIKGKDSESLRQRLALEEERLRLQEELELEQAEGTYEKSLEILAEYERRRAELVAAATAEIAAVREREEIEAITDVAIRERELRLLALRETLARELEAAGGNNAKQIEAHRKYHEERRKIELDSANQSRTMLTSLLSFNDAFAAELGKKQDNQLSEETKRKREELDKQVADLQEQQKQGVLSYQEASEKIMALEQEKTAAMQAEGEKRSALENALTQGSRAIAASLTGTIIEEERKRQERIALLREDAAQKTIEIQALQAEITRARAAGDADAEQAAMTRIERAKIDLAVTDTEQTQLMQDNAEKMLIAAGASFANLVAQGENAGKAVLKVAFDVLQGMIPILTAQIFGITAASPANIATLGVWGAVQFVALTAALQGLVSLARSAAGFKDGVVGIKGPGTTTSDSIPAWLSRSETVVTAKGTLAKGGVADNADIFRWVNKTGKPIEDYPGLRKFMASPQEATALAMQKLFAAPSINPNIMYEASGGSTAGVERRLQRIEATLVDGFEMNARRLDKAARLESRSTSQTRIKGGHIVTTHEHHIRKRKG